jgi:hypothetical protein
LKNFLFYNKNFVFQIYLSVISNGKVIHVNLFDIEKKDYILEYDEGETSLKCENNWAIYEFEQKIRETFLLGENEQAVHFIFFI